MSATPNKMSHHVKLSKRERAAQLPFVGRVHKWRRAWVAAKATKINVRQIKWVKTSALASALRAPPPRGCSRHCCTLRPAACCVNVKRAQPTAGAADELATETPAPRNPDLEVVKAPDERPPLPKIHRKVPEPVQPRQRSTRVRVIGSLPNRGFLKIDTC
jgi:hypothetical protein